jgi:hypothetical protein
MRMTFWMMTTCVGKMAVVALWPKMICFAAKVQDVVVWYVIYIFVNVYYTYSVYLSIISPVGGCPKSLQKTGIATMIVKLMLQVQVPENGVERRFRGHM